MNPAVGTNAIPRRAVTSRTKMIIVNTPHNPVGKVFTRAELEGIAAIAEEHNLLIMSDEVVSADTYFNHALFIDGEGQYDCLVFDGKEHVRIATLPGMWDRTVTVGSAGSMYPSFRRFYYAHIACFRGFRCYWMEDWLVDGTTFHHSTHSGGHHTDRVLFKFTPSRSGCMWIGRSQGAPILRNTIGRVHRASCNHLQRL